MAGYLQLTIGRGETFDPYVRLWSAKESEGGVVLPLADYTKARLTIRSAVDSDTALVELDETSGITINTDEDKFEILLSAAATAALRFTQAVFDMEVETAAGKVTTILEGPVTVKRRNAR